MQFIAQMMLDERPVEWSARREAEGWAAISAGDHFWFRVHGSYPHQWVALGQFAATTSSVQLLSLFANNLVRSPVEFAYAALSMQQVSGGRFEAGLGAGWQRADCEPCGIPFPGPAERARRFKEAATVVRALLRTGKCSFEGEFYQIEVDSLPMVVDPPPPLVLAVGGPWTLRHVAPLADVVEVVAFAHVLRDGRISGRAWSSGGPEDIGAAVDRARAANSLAPIQIGAFVAVGNSPEVRQFEDLFAGGSQEGLAGEPRRVAETLLSFERFGVSRCSLSELVPGSYERLAPFLT
jgi:alkanesulfonate monooxygenase SsuD/methylene tetrahydromethanopterin reductase-like flavin-dependent oxidoreductase (luciferase family)